MDIETLRTFMILTNTRSFTRTATQQFIAQSTVTNRINELEKELNVTLFTRTHRNVELTLEGEQFKEYAEKVIELTDASLAEITSLRKFDNHLRIGCSDSIYNAHLASCILTHQKKHPKDSLKITIGMSNHLIEQIQDDIFDVIFSYLPLQKTAFECEIYKQDELVLVTSYKNQKYASGIEKEQLIAEKYLMCNFALQDVGQFIRNIFPKYHQFSLEIDDCSKIVPFILSQNSYTFLPKEMAMPYIKDKKLIQVPLLDLETPVINSYIVCKKSKWNMIKYIFGL